MDKSDPLGAHVLHPNFCSCHLHRQVRLNIPSTLLEEAYTYLHSFLTASLINRKLFLQPFHRDVEVTQPAARAMRAALMHCQKASWAMFCILMSSLRSSPSWAGMGGLAD